MHDQDDSSYVLSWMHILLMNTSYIIPVFLFQKFSIFLYIWCPMLLDAMQKTIISFQHIAMF